MRLSFCKDLQLVLVRPARGFGANSRDGQPLYFQLFCASILNRDSSGAKRSASGKIGCFVLYGPLGFLLTGGGHRQMKPRILIAFFGLMRKVRLVDDHAFAAEGEFKYFHSKQRKAKMVVARQVDSG